MTPDQAPPASSRTPAETVALLQLEAVRLDDIIRAKDRLIARLELKLYWTRKFNEGLRERTEQLISDMADKQLPAIENAAEKDRKKEG